MQQSIDKEAIKRQFLPRAVLLAQTDQAAAAIPIKNQFDDMIPIWKFPYRIGRESRVEVDDHGHIIVKERFKHGMKSVPTNDIYLIDFGERLQISRDHLQIVEEDGKYYVIDDGSKCGTGVNEKRIGGDSDTERTEIEDGDTIVLGTSGSPYRYTFVLFSEEGGQKV
ncbi:FHA domain-containing protein [Hydrogenimonas urashimensis]|uniref:FHA domain-containing protein n=1 Tax=Hydrogenimonas urashimensis TaxID=2740515 RepID=UPI001915CA8E|nr:FHA domain-containing protein [Hydrogenimonas urashimensis]